MTQKVLPFIETKDDFKEFTQGFFTKNPQPYAYSVGHAFRDSDGPIIAVRWLTVNIENNFGFYAAAIAPQEDFQREENTPQLISLNGTCSETLDLLYPFSGEKGHQNIDALNAREESKKDVVMMIYPTRECLDKPPVSSADVLCRLTMISRLQFKPNELCLDGIFKLLHRLYYTANGAYTPEQWEEMFAKGREVGQLIAVDKFPPLYWGAPVPSGVRIASPAQVRLGAYLSPGTVVMPAGFVNFNAGTLGEVMVEGRISAGVVVDTNSNIGGGASIRGKLSGGGTIRITVGKNCLLGANSGIGISLGDRSTVEAGLVINPGMWVKVLCPKIASRIQLTGNIQSGVRVKALQLSGLSDMLFIRNSTNGQVEVRANNNPIHLNMNLHH